MLLTPSHFLVFVEMSLGAGLFTLSQAAKKSGGDKYSGHLIVTKKKMTSGGVGEGDGQSEQLPLVLYLPQHLSRKKMRREGGASSVVAATGHSDELGSPCEALTASVKEAEGSSQFEGENSCGILFRLVKAAKAGGGDKYEGESRGEKMQVYLPQEVSRQGEGKKIRNEVLLCINFPVDDTKSIEATYVSHSVPPQRNANSVATQQNLEIASGLFKIEAMAKGGGGDKYAGDLSTLESSGKFHLELYVPQCFSRPSKDQPAHETLVLTLFVGAVDGNGVHLQLSKAAKKTGGDKYQGEVKDEKLTIYIPQEISRKGQHGDGGPAKVFTLVIDNEANQPSSILSKRKLDS